MYIKKLVLRHFRNIEDALEIPFKNNHTIVLGANGAGKSNIPAGIAFVLNCDAGFLGIEDYEVLINDQRKRAAPDTASCTVTLVLEMDGGGEIALQKTLNTKCESVYEVDNEQVTEVHYKTRLRELHLQASAMLLPQRFARASVTDKKYGYGKFLETFVEFFNDLEFSAEEEEQLQKSAGRASQLKQKIRHQRRLVGQLTKLQPTTATITENYEERMRQAQRLLTIAGLWNIDEKRKKHLLTLEELRASDVEARRVDAENNIEIVQEEISIIRGKLEDLQQTKAQDELRREELETERKLLVQLANSRDKLRDLIAKAQNSQGPVETLDTEFNANLLKELQQLEASDALRNWLQDNMGDIEEKFREEHPADAETLEDVEKQLGVENTQRGRLQLALAETKNKRSIAKDQQMFLEEYLETLKKDKSHLQTQLDIEGSFLKKHQTTLLEMHGTMTWKRNRLASIRRFRASPLQKSVGAGRNEFELRCLIGGLSEFFADDLPSRPLYGLLRDLIEPKEKEFAPAFRRFLGRRLNAIVVKDADVRTSLKEILEGDAYYEAPKMPILVLPREQSAGRGSTTSRWRPGIIPLARTWRVSKNYAGDRDMSKRILRLIKKLAKDAVICSADTTGLPNIPPRRGRRNPPRHVVTYDGTMCSNSRDLTFFSSREVSEPTGIDGLLSMQEFEREIHALENFIRRTPGLALVLHNFLQYRLEVSIEKTTKSLELKEAEIKGAASKLTQLRSTTANLDEMRRKLEDELEIFRTGQKTMALRAERKRITLIKMEYIRAITVNLSDAEISQALERAPAENLLEQEYFLNKLIQIYEDYVETECGSRIHRQMETHGKDRLEEITVEHDRVLQACEETARHLSEFGTDQQDKSAEELRLKTTLDELNARLSELFKTTKKLSREAATNSIKERRHVLSLMQLHRSRGNLISRLNGGSQEGAAQDDDENDESSPEVEVNYDRLLGPVDPVDYTALPETAKASEDGLTDFMRSTKLELSKLRSEKADQLMGIDDSGPTSENQSEINSKIAALRALEENLQAELMTIAPVKEKKVQSNRRRNELLEDFYEKLPNGVAMKFWELTHRQIAMDVIHPSNGAFVDSVVRFRLKEREILNEDESYREEFSGGAQAALLLSIMLAVQEIFEVPILILDEIDARTSMSVSRQCHRLLQRYASSKQIICISHQPRSADGDNVRFIGVVRCPVSSTTKVLTYDPRAIRTPADLEFNRELSEAIVNYILTGVPLARS